MVVFMYVDYKSFKYVAKCDKRYDQEDSES